MQIAQNAMKISVKITLIIAVFILWLLVRPYLFIPYKINELSPSQIYSVELREKYAPNVFDSGALYGLYLKAGKGNSSLTGLSSVPIGAWGKLGGLFNEKEPRFGDSYTSHRWDAENVLRFQSSPQKKEHDVIYLHNATEKTIAYLSITSASAAEIFLVFDIPPKSSLSIKPSMPLHANGNVISLRGSGGFLDQTKISNSYMYFGIDHTDQTPTNYCVTIQLNGITFQSEKSAGAWSIDYDPAVESYVLTKDLAKRIPRTLSCRVPSP
jgi:hypothetical protein